MRNVKKISVKAIETAKVSCDRGVEWPWRGKRAGDGPVAENEVRFHQSAHSERSGFIGLFARNPQGSEAVFFTFEAATIGGKRQGAGVRAVEGGLYGKEKVSASSSQRHEH